MTTVIGIPARQVNNDSTYTPLFGVYDTYVKAIVSAGGVPLIIPILDDFDAIESLYKLTHGLLLTGGEDVSPSLYGEEPHVTVRNTDIQRDKTEIHLINLAARDKKPLFAICRGTQVLNVAMKGTLYQDIPTQLGLEGHKQPAGDRSMLFHKIDILPESKLSKLLNVTSLEVNTLHHQSIKDLAPGFHIVAKSPDGVIEAIEAENDWFALGVQCHPEDLCSSRDIRWANVFKELIINSKKFILPAV